MLTPREKNPLYRWLRGGSNTRRCIAQDSEPNTLPTELFRPRLSFQLSVSLSEICRCCLLSPNKMKERTKQRKEGRKKERKKERKKAKLLLSVTVAFGSYCHCTFALQPFVSSFVLTVTVVFRHSCHCRLSLMFFVTAVPVVFRKSCPCRLSSLPFVSAATIVFCYCFFAAAVIVVFRYCFSL